MLDNCKILYLAQRVGLVLTLLLLLNACASTIVVEGEVPQPLVNRLPLTGQMLYSDEFKTFTYIEAEKGRSLKGLDFGAAQTGMFDTVFGRLLTLNSDAGQDIDISIEPQILDFQYTSPRETKLKMYEVWLKYRLRLIDREGQELADWTLKGYGKTPTLSMTTALTAFNMATIVALRDVGAQLAIRFPNQSSIKALVASKQTVPPVAPAESPAGNTETEQVGANNE